MNSSELTRTFPARASGPLTTLMVLELKIDRLEPDYIAKMQFSVSALDDTVRLLEDQPSIGMTVCKSNGRLLLVHAFKDAPLPI